MNQISVQGYQVAISNTVTDVPGAGNCRFALMDVGNNNAAVSFVQVFNRAAANISLGSTAPLLTFEIPANSGRTIPLGVLANLGGDGFSIAGTTGRANSTAPVTALDVNILY